MINILSFQICVSDDQLSEFEEKLNKLCSEYNAEILEKETGDKK